MWLIKFDDCLLRCNVGLIFFLFLVFWVLRVFNWYLNVLRFCVGVGDGMIMEFLFVGVGMMKDF